MMRSEILGNWKRLRIGDFDTLRTIAALPEGQAQILSEVAKIVDARTGTSASNLEETFMLGVQLRSVWPSGTETNIALRRIGDHSIAFMCGFVGRTFDDAYDMISHRWEQTPVKEDILEIDSPDHPSDHIVASVATAA